MANINRKIFTVILGSFLSQIVQVGIFSLFLTQKLNDLNVQLSLIGWFVGIQWIAVLLIAPLAPKIGARYGLERLNQFSCLVTLVGILLAFTSNPLILILSAVLLGAGLIMRWVACDALVVHLTEPGKVGRMIGVHEAMMGFGIAAGPLFFIWLQLEQIIYAMLLLVFSATVCFLLGGQKQVAKAGNDSQAIQKQDFLIIKFALMMALVGGFIETASVAFLPFYFEADGYALSFSAWFVSAFGLGGTLLQLPLGYLADSIGYRRAQLVACLVALFAFAALYWSPNEFVLIYGILFLLGGAVGAFNTLAVIQAGSEISSHKTASIMTIIAVAYTAGGIVGPIVTASVLDIFPENAILATYSCIIAAVAMMMFPELGRKRTRQPADIE